MADSEGSYGRREERQVLDLGKLIVDSRKNPSTPRQDPRPNAQIWTPRPQESSEESPSILEDLVQPQSGPATVQPQQNEEEPAPAPQDEQPASAGTPINTGRLGTSLLTEPVTEDQGKKSPSPSDFLTPYRNQPKPLNPVTEKKDDAPLTSSIMYQDWKNLINSGAGSGADSAEIPFSSGTSQQDVSVLGNGYVQPVTGGNTYWTGYRRNSYEPNGSNAALLNSLGNSLLNGLNNAGTPAWLNPTPIIDNRINSGTPYRQTEFDRAVKNSLAGVINSAMDNIGNSLRNQPGNILADSAGAFIDNRQGGGNNPFVNDAFNNAVRDTFAPPISSTIDLNSPVLSGNDPMAQFADLFEPQGERLNPSISEFDEQQALDALNSTTGRGPIDYSDVTANIGSEPFSFQDPQWLQDLTGGNSLAGVISDTAANALDSILRIGSGGPVTPQADIPLDRAGDYILGQLIGSDNVAPAVNFGNSIAQNPAVSGAVREIGDYMLDQQLGKANADELRSRFGIETTPSTIMNQPTPANYDRNGTPGNQRYVPQTGSTTGGTTQPTTTAPQTTGSGSSGKNFAEGLSDWISGLVSGNNTDGSNGTPRPGADAYLNSTQGGTTTPQGGTTSGTTPTTTQPATGNQTGGTTAPQTTGSQGGNTSPYDNPNRYNPDSSAYYSRKFDDLMEDNRDLGGTLNGESIRKLLDTPININNSFKDIIATDFAYDTRDPLSQGTDISREQYTKEFNAFLDANPTIKSMVENKEISVQDVINTYLKNQGGPASGSGSGNGSSKPDGSKTYQPSYEQGGQVVKAPYKKGGYSEDELKNMGNKPYKDYRGNTAYEGYYYWNGRWYPVDQDKANYYNYYGTYNGYNDDMKQYYNTFGTYYGYRPGWRTAGRTGGGRRYGGGGGRGGGGSSGGGAGSGSTSSSDEIRVYNIMKNWSF